MRSSLPREACTADVFEDIGLADPRGQTLALEACEIYERLGSPEGELAIAEAVVFMACAAKSNAVYVAFGEAMEDAAKYGSLDVPLHLRNAPTRLMKQLGYGKDIGMHTTSRTPMLLARRTFPKACPSASTTNLSRAAWR